MVEHNIISKTAEIWNPKRRDFLRAFGSGATGLALGGISGCGGGAEGVDAMVNEAQSRSYALAMDEDY